MAVALYFLDKLALRAGHEKDEDEADTVGCCTLKVCVLRHGAVCGSMAYWRAVSSWPVQYNVMQTCLLPLWQGCGASIQLAIKSCKCVFSGWLQFCKSGSNGCCMWVLCRLRMLI